MKLKFLIVLGIIGVAVISTSIFISIKYQEFHETSNSSFNYKKTESTTNETFLSMTVNEWQEVSFDELMNYHENYGKRGFFEDLGALLIKNEMLLQIERENIVNANDDFEVYPGMVLTSLPPHVNFEAIVNGTDGNSYRLQGATFANSVGGVKISKLVFYDIDEKVPMTSILSQIQTIKIEEDQNGARATPYHLIIHADKNNTVEFENTLIIPIRIQGNGDWKNPNWYGPTILPFGKATMTFNNTGVIEWHARSLPLPGSEASDHKGGGQINILSDETSKLPLDMRGRIASAILQNSEIPWSGMGTRTDGLYIDFSPAIFEMLPHAKEYYTARAEQLIPFDVPIIIEEPEIILDSDILR